MANPAVHFGTPRRAAKKRVILGTCVSRVRTRTIALPAVAVTALRAHRIHQLEARLAAGARWQDRGFVFTSGIGTPMEPRRITREFRALLTRAGLPPIRLHDLRHSCATLLLVQGVSPRVVVETLGHSQISLTLNS